MLTIAAVPPLVTNFLTLTLKEESLVRSLFFSHSKTE
jgi:hypothetical protein